MFDDLIEKLNGTVKKLRGRGKLTEKNISDAMRDLRRVLLEADVNYRVAKDFIARVQEKAVGSDVLQSITPGQQVVKIVHDELIELLGKANVPLHLGHTPPSVVMIVGLQGSGKTTFTGKLGALLKKKGREPLLVAADVYRPAAIDQLKTVGNSVNLPVFSKDIKDPVTIAKDAVLDARRHGNDVLLVDTAGRLHVDDALMEELSSIKDEVNPSEILFVADGMTGQDAVKSAQAFLEKLEFDGIVLTKLDGDTRGGAALSIRAVTGKPIKYVSVGEKLDEIEIFHPDRMASRILGMGDVVTLVEKAQDAVDKKQAEKLAKKIKKAAFNLDDFYDQLQQLKKMGPMDQIAGMIPGMSGKMKGMQVDESALVQVEAIINSMTNEEKNRPQIINGSRRKRIAMGSGTRVQDVNRLLKQFQMMQKMVKQMSRFGSRGMPKGMPLGF